MGVAETTGSHVSESSHREHICHLANRHCEERSLRRGNPGIFSGLPRRKERSSQ